MRGRWEQKKLGEVCSLINRGIAPKYIDAGGIAVLNQKCVRDHDVFFELGRRHDVDAKRIDPERYVRIGDVLVNSTGVGTLGRVAQIRVKPTEPTTVDTHVTIVRPEPERFYPDFFGYMLILIEDEIARSGEGASGQTELARTTLQNKFTVSFPTSLSDQQRIVAILDEAFAGLATATANAEKNLKSTRKLFDSYLNAIFAQKGDSWTTSTIGNAVVGELIFAPQDGNHGEIHPKKSDYVDQGVPFIMASDLQNGEVNCVDCNFISDKTALGLRKGFAKDGDVLLSHKGTIGRVAFLKTDRKFVLLTPQVTYYRVRNSDVISNRFLPLIFESSAFQREITRIAGAGSTRAYIGIKKQLELEISYPTLAEQLRLADALDGLREKSQLLEATYKQKMNSLMLLKQSLLHRAFSGELTSSPSQAIQEAAE